MNFYVLVLLFLNILTIFGLPTESEDCKNLRAFFSIYPGYKFSNCCGNANICDVNGNIIHLEVRAKNLKDVDFSNFPILANLNTLVLEGKLYKNGVFPSFFFRMPNLKALHVTESNVKSFEEIPSSCSLELLSFYHGELNGFPKEVFNCSKLKTLDLSYNNIESIPENINSLKNLEELLFIDSKLRDLPDSIYDINLKKLHLNKNHSLQAKLYKFNNPIEECSLGNTDLNCYEPGTCKVILEDPEKLKKQIGEESFKKCEAPRNDKPSSSKLYIIIGALITLIILCAVLVVIKKKNKNNEVDNEESGIQPEMSIILNADALSDAARSPTSSLIKNEISF